MDMLSIMSQEVGLFEGNFCFGVQESSLSCRGKGKASEDFRKKMLTIRNQHGFTKKRNGLPVVLLLLGGHGIPVCSWHCSRQQSRKLMALLRTVRAGRQCTRSGWGCADGIISRQMRRPSPSSPCTSTVGLTRD